MWTAMERRRRADAGDGRFAFGELHRALHEKARLGIMTCLVTEPDGIRFGGLKRLCALTDGNLSRHLAVLQAAGFVEIWKGFEERRPQTLCRATREGRRRFVSYLEALDRIVRNALPKARKTPGRRRALAPGWHKSRK
ncbi:transcriptional regulator [soil metagenome]